jgi:acetaldehyde dehydrogenase (acetylating)
MPEGLVDAGLADADLISIQEVRLKVDRAYQAFQHYRNFTQAQVDAIVEAVAAAARQHSPRLAEMAVAETSYGNAPHKHLKNMLAADLLPKAMRGVKTVGILRELPEQGITEIGVPVGVVAAILPTTNPTSTAIYKTLIALKSGNAIVMSPHPRARRCSCETASILAQAAEAAGAPHGVVQCVGNATIEGTNELMRHRRTSVILSTGGAGIVKAAYSSGKPAFGVGPGNVPILLDDNFDPAECVRNVLAGKSFDNGTLCSSEQTLVATNARKQAVLDALKAHGAYLCNADQGKALSRALITEKWTINAACVGQAAPKVARMAGFEVPADTRVLAVEIGGVGKEYPLSMEKLSPVLSLLFVPDWEAQIRACQAILKFGGLGHTCGLYSNDAACIQEYGLRMPAFRVVVNTPTPLGSTGITTGLQPALTLGCGAMSGNSTGDNVGPLHLVNVKRVARVLRRAEEVLAISTSAPTQNAAPHVADAVERFLAARGIAAGTTATRSAATSVVDRFLESKKTTPAPVASCSSCSAPAQSKAQDPAPAIATPPAPAALEFVCEADVRMAVNRSTKIYVSTKTIITPAARDMASQYDVFITVAAASPAKRQESE